MESISDARPKGRVSYYMGVDVARTGRDETVYTITAVDEHDVCFVEEVVAESQSNVVDVAGRVGDFTRKYNVETIFIDETGLSLIHI